MPATNPSPHQETLASALDAAIHRVAVAEFESLRAGLSQDQVRVEIERSLTSSRDLKEGSIPEYNRWDALLYATWFQPGHANLAYSVASWLLRGSAGVGQAASRSRRLQVVDFGCGALAMQFGAVLAAANATSDAADIESIAVHSMDSGAPMLAIGCDIWREFTRAAAADPRLSDLARTIGLTTSDTYQIAPGTPPWSLPAVRPDSARTLAYRPARRVRRNPPVHPRHPLGVGRQRAGRHHDPNDPRR